jgi:hypothetical protein
MSGRYLGVPYIFNLYKLYEMSVNGQNMKGFIFVLRGKHELPDDDLAVKRTIGFSFPSYWTTGLYPRKQNISHCYLHYSNNGK